ncbi:MAG: proliferating cell nuclear antigen (pcna) [Thermofilaceae archaeon]
MPLLFEFPDARDWRYLIESLETVIEEASFIADNEALRLRALDSSRIAMVDLYLPRESFSTYEIDEVPTRIGVNFDEFNKILKRAKADDKIICRVEGGRLKVTLSGKAERTFSLPIISTEGGELPVPKVTFDVTAKMVSDTFRDSLKEAELISDTIRFAGEQRELKLAARSDKGEWEAIFSMEKGSLIEYEVRQPSYSSYSLEYLNDIVGKAYRISDLVTIEFSTNKPLCLTFDIAAGGILRFFLAPRME